MQKVMEPTPERLAKGDIAETDIEIRKNVFVPCLRSSGALYTLRKSGAIQDCHVAAAEMWARDYETGILGARDPLAGKSGAKSDPELSLISRAAAVTRCESVRRSLGEVSGRFLRLMMIEGMSVNQMRQAMQKDHAKISGAIELLLEQLVELYDGMPGAQMK
ncbi:hypothetical protein [Acetobacter persici]|uniref:hypothetical protein n=1 Tax=Acetobacter persici TaxID=1076596 RepID=UPI001F214117|nr:hypothetical protein [Acetobacter persici]MCG0998175.1 hypothetical protein [Acetobacter persici]